VPGRIAIAFVAEFGLYELGLVHGPFTELLRILEKTHAIVPGRIAIAFVAE